MQMFSYCLNELLEEGFPAFLLKQARLSAVLRSTRKSGVLRILEKIKLQGLL